MNQLDLFAAAPVMARPARPDTAMLLAMSPDYVPGNVSQSKPNAHGIYPEKDAEKLELPRNVKGWKGGPTASIYLLQCPEGWLASFSMQLFTGDCRGCSHALSPKWHGDRFLASRREGLDYAVERISKAVATHDGRDAQRVRQWLAAVL